MRKQFMRPAALLLAAITALSCSASALFGRSAPEADEGAPAARDVEVRTYTNIPCQSQFLAVDREGEDVTFALAEAPKKGTVTIDGANFTYTPKDGAKGSDRFTYTASDSAGHVSSPATVTVTIERVRSGVTYADTDQDTACAAAAQCLAERGVFTGARIGNKYYFEPARQVTREEFLAMVLETAGREVTDVTMTGFSDDDAIPTWAKGYVSAAVTDGVVYGKPTEAGPAFQGASPISFREAAAILDRVLDLGDVDLDEWYADREAAPTWASQAVGNMEAFQVMAAGSFGSDTLAGPVTRADAAKMLSAAGTLLAGGEEASSGLLGWLS